MPMVDDAYRADAQLQLSRRIIAVVDLVESVALMERHELDIVDRWRRFVSSVLDQVLPGFDGRMIKHLGDGMLLVFTGVRESVEASFALHRLIAEFNRGRTPEQAMWLRIGLHQADVVVDSIDVLGHGVNLAARIASVAGPGETVCSVEIREELTDSLGVELQDLGECFLKHIQAPCRVFRLGPPSGRVAAPPSPRFQDHRPGVVVIPFDVVAVDPADAVLGHALADEVTAGVAGTSLLRVVSRLSARPFAGSSTPIVEIRRALGVSYVVSGRCNVQGHQLRLLVELTDARSGDVLWTHATRLTRDEVLLPTGGVVAEIVEQIGRHALEHEIGRTRSLPFHALDDYSLFIGGVGLMNRLSRPDFERSVEVFKQLSERLPRIAAPLAMRARWHVMRMMQGWAGSAAEEADQARAHARRAIALNPDESLAMAVDALVTAHVDSDLAAALHRATEATQVGPNDAYAWLVRSGLHSYMGMGAAADEAAAQAIALSPLDPARFQYAAYAAMAKLLRSDWSAAVEWADTSLRLNCLFTGALRIKAIALAMDDQVDEARQCVQKMLVIQPGFTVTEYMKRYPGRSSAHAADFAQALRDGGVPA